LPEVWSQFPEVQSAFTEQAEQVGAAQEQTLFWQARPPQSVLFRHPSTHLPVLVSQLPVAQSALLAQVAQSAPAPVGATQRQEKVLTLQLPPGQSGLVRQALAHLPEVGSQELEAQSALMVQVEQAGAGGEVQPQVPPPPPVLQTKPPQSAALAQASVQRLFRQVPVAHWVLAVHAAHSGEVPTAQVQVLVFRLQA